jgi:dUTP pyrophosphatase
MNVFKNIQLCMTDETVKQPCRSTTGSAGHDIFSPKFIEISPKQVLSIELPFYFKKLGEVSKDFKIAIYLRSSVGIKKKIRLYEDGDVIDHIVLKPFQTNLIHIYNDSDQILQINKNEHFCQFVICEKDYTHIPEIPFRVESVISIELAKHSIIKSTVEYLEYYNGCNYIIQESITLQPNEQRVLATGLKAYIPQGTWLGVYISPELQNVILANGVAVIDADYADNEANDGHMFFAIVNRSSDELVIPAGTNIAHMIVEYYYVLESEESINTLRSGGIGST